MAEKKRYEGAKATVAEIAERFSVSTRTVARWIDAGTIPHRRVGGAIRFNLEEVDDWAKASAEAALNSGTAT